MSTFKRIMKYICHIGVGKFLTGDIDEQVLIYEKLDVAHWVLRYDILKEGRANRGIISETENQRRFNPERVVSRFLPDRISAVVRPSLSLSNESLVIRGAFNYDSEDPLIDDFSARTKTKDQMLEQLRTAFDDMRERIHSEHKRLAELLKNYEHLPIKG